MATVGSAARKMRARALNRGWGTWVVAWEVERDRRRHARAAARLRNQGLSRGWQAWLSTAEFERKRRLVRAAGIKLSHRGLSRGWDAWAAVHADSLAKQRIRLALGRMRNRHLSVGWLAWAEAWTEAARLQALLRQAAVRLCLPRLLAAYTGWAAGWRVEEAERVARHAMPPPSWEEVEARESKLMAQVC